VREPRGDDLIKRFRDAQKRGRSHREMDSVATQIRFLMVFAERSKQPGVPEFRAALDRLATQVTTR